MKKFAALVAVLCLAVLLSNANPAWAKNNGLNYAQQEIQVGQYVWFNDINVGDSIFWCNMDKNGFLKPHDFKKLTRGKLVGIAQISFDSSSSNIETIYMLPGIKGDNRSCRVAILTRCGRVVQRSLVSAIPQQGVLLLNW